MDSLGDRMKINYESVFNIHLPKRVPLIIRIDGKAFHGLKIDKPFDAKFIDYMNQTAVYLCKNIQGAVLAYIQSDEISILLHNYKKLNSQSWFDNELQKVVSISAALAASYFTSLYKVVQFDSRAFVIPEAEVCNYFIWRQQDWERNSIQMLAQSLYSHKQLHKKNNSQLQELCFQKGKNWNDLSGDLKRGRCAVYRNNNWIIDNEIPIFTRNRNYIEDLLKTED